MFFDWPQGRGCFILISLLLSVHALLSSLMKILKYIPIIVMFVLISGGCNERKQKKNHLEDISLNELMPKGGPKYTKDIIVGLSVFVFEVDKHKYSNVQSALGGKSGLQVDASNGADLAANGIVCGNGDTKDWPAISRRLADANAAVVNRVTLFMTENISEQIELAGFEQGASLFYQPDSKTTAVMGLPQGSVQFNITAKSLIGLKQVCELEIKPIYKTIKQKVEEKRISAWQYVFDSATCKSQIRPGQFVFISSQTDEFRPSERKSFSNVGELIFTTKENEKRVKICLIICGLIKD